MNMEALMAALHYGAIFSLAGTLMVEYVFLRQPDVRPYIDMLARTDIIYFIAAIFVVATGLARTFWYGKGLDFYLGTWLFHLKITLIVLTVLISIAPTLRILRWQREQAAGTLAAAPSDQRSTRLLVLLEMHIVFTLPFIAVYMARGYGRIG